MERESKLRTGPDPSRSIERNSENISERCGRTTGIDINIRKRSVKLSVKRGFFSKKKKRLNSSLNYKRVERYRCSLS